ncbi:MAG TPA: methyltransferase [Candidatus Binatia bacterium]|nr:methyltransferase [Candidatus Binatia bacterium]
MATADVEASSLALVKMLTGSWVSQALYVAAKLGIADLLRDGPTSCTMLAEATQTHAGALYRVLRALASVGVFAEDKNRCFSVTPLAEPLRADAPGSLRAFAIMLGEREHWRAWESVLHSVRTGQPAFEDVFGMPLFQYFAGHPEAARIFDEAMTSRSGQENAAIVAAYHFAEARTVIDVGGGQGTLLASILDVHPNARGVLFDLPHVIAPARIRMESAGHAVRCEFVAGDFFGVVPAGGDLYLLKKVIHDWDDDRAQLILTRCRTAMSGTGRLLLIEPVVPPGNEASFNKLLDLLMLVWNAGGRERTEGEHVALLALAGFRRSRVIPTRSGLTIIEAAPI